MRLILLGPPGAGKGTQGLILTQRLEIPKVSTGEMLREAVVAGDTIGLATKSFTDRGLLVPDAIVIEIVRRRLMQEDARSGFLLDGFPRTVNQAEAVEAILIEQKQQLDAAVELKVSEAEIVERISNRRVCPNCVERSYHLQLAPPRVPGRCDECASTLVQRDDDRAQVVRARLRTYQEQTSPLTGYYQERGLLVQVDGLRPVEEVTASILMALEDRARAG